MSTGRLIIVDKLLVDPLAMSQYTYCFKVLHNQFFLLRGSAVLEEPRTPHMKKGEVISTTPNPQPGRPMDYT
jgi:hypothetical protein